MNKWFNKQTVLSFIIGGMLFSSVGVFAATQLNVTPNKYPVVVNGENVDVEGYNIEGRTYLQLRDITDILGISLDFKNNTIYINSDKSDKVNNTITQTPDGIEIIYVLNDNFEYDPNGEPYLDWMQVTNKCKSLNFDFIYDDKTQKYIIKDMNNNIVVDNIPVYQKGRKYILYSDYVNIIMPIINNVDPTKSTLEQRLNKPASTPDGITDIDVYDGKYYIGILYVQNKIKEKGYDLIRSRDNNNLKVTKDNQIIIENIPFRLLSGFGYDAIEYDYYVGKILPLIK
jgi:hypothetical protein